MSPKKLSQQKFQVYFSIIPKHNTYETGFA